MEIHKRSATNIGPDFQTIGVKVVEFFAVYAGTKVLDFACDQVKSWIKSRRKNPYLITLSLGFGGKTKQIRRTQKHKRKG